MQSVMGNFIYSLSILLRISVARAVHLLAIHYEVSLVSHRFIGTIPGEISLYFSRSIPLN